MTFSGSRVGRPEASPPPPAQVGWAGLRGLPKETAPAGNLGLGEAKEKDCPRHLSHRR